MGDLVRHQAIEVRVVHVVLALLKLGELRDSRASRVPRILANDAGVDVLLVAAAGTHLAKIFHRHGELCVTTVNIR